MAKRYLLLVKDGIQKLIKFDVNGKYHRRGTDPCLRRILIEEYVEEHLSDWIDREWFGARVYTIFPPREIR